MPPAGLDLLWKAGALVAAMATIIAVLKISLAHVQEGLEELKKTVQGHHDSLGEQIRETTKEHSAALARIETATELNKHRIEKLESEVERIRPRLHALECTWGDPRRGHTD